MKGYAELLQDRCAGHIPSAVFISLDHEPLDGSVNEVQIEDKDRPQLLDLRALQGLTVILSGTCRRRLLEAIRSCDKAGAARVVATHSEKRSNGEFEALEVFDTQGELIWKK